MMTIHISQLYRCNPRDMISSLFFFLPTDLLFCRATIIYTLFISYSESTQQPQLSVIRFILIQVSAWFYPTMIFLINSSVQSQHTGCGRMPSCFTHCWFVALGEKNQVPKSMQANVMIGYGLWSKRCPPSSNTLLDVLYDSYISVAPWQLLRIGLFRSLL